MSTTIRAPTTVTIRPPSKYAATAPAAAAATAAEDTSAAPSFVAPPLSWLEGTWSVTHSTLAMWRSAQNVRITYAVLAPKSDGAPRIDDLVEYESNTPGKKGVKSVAGVDTCSSSGPGETSAWDWRGKSWLFFVHSHWEVLGWGERPLPDGSGVERWVVTWFAPTVFTKEGVDFYSDHREGLSEAATAELMAALRKGPAPLAEMVDKDMKPVDIKLPWQERS